MSDKIDSTEVGGFWDKLFYLVKLITGDVKISTKGTLQNQIDEMSTKVDDCFTSVSDGKKAVASAITDKGVTTAQNAEFATMAANVRKIKTNPTLQTKTVTLDTSNTTQTLTPDTGYDGLSQVKASITTQTKSVNLSTSEQVVKPDSGKVLSQVTVPAVTGSAGLKDVVTGKTFNSATAGIGKTGTLPDKRGTTVDAAAVDQDDTYTYFTVPTEAVYDAKSKLRTLSSNLAPKLLWTNPDITKGWWPPYTVELDIGNYDYIIVQLISTMDDTKKPFYIFTSIKEWYGNVTGALVFNGITYQRWITSITASLITFGSGAPNNSHAIPYKIYGFNITL